MSYELDVENFEAETTIGHNMRRSRSESENVGERLNRRGAKRIRLREPSRSGLRFWYAMMMQPGGRTGSCEQQMKAQGR